MRQEVVLPTPSPLISELGCHTIVGSDPDPVLGSVSSAAVVAGNKTESGVGWRCRACAAFFTSEKLLEKHYFANHEFKCKFCEQGRKCDIDTLSGRWGT